MIHPCQISEAAERYLWWVESSESTNDCIKKHQFPVGKANESWSRRDADQNSSNWSRISSKAQQANDSARWNYCTDLIDKTKWERKISVWKQLERSQLNKVHLMTSGVSLNTLLNTYYLTISIANIIYYHGSPKQDWKS